MDPVVTQEEGAPPQRSSAPGGRSEPNPLYASIAEQVRKDSRTQVRPTRLEVLDDEGNPLDCATVRAVLAAMKQIPKYADIAYVETPDGGVHAYSDRYIIEKHAALCATASLGDNPAAIAGTVREESQIYPRPTPLEFFGMEPWCLTAKELEEALLELERSEAYADIQRVTASNGAVYLYSDRFMSSEVAQGMAEWEAVGRDKNP
jgi:hypothetical protein